MENKRHIYTISVVNGYITNIFNAEEMLHDIYVVGEISGFSERAGTAFFSLKDKTGQLSCICFNIDNTYIPHDGEKVILRGSVRYYNKRGSLYFDVYKIEPEGQGEQYRKYLELKEKLTKEGIFEQEHKKPLPYIINNVCILTSLNGAVIQDILHTVVGHCMIENITAVDTRVQGDNAVDTIVSNLKIADTYGYDLIIIARGGGSQEDLMPFNDERLVRAVFDAKTPVVSAVGHETDYTLCDFVADVRALTPTMAGKLVVDAWARVLEDLNAYKTTLSHGLENKAEEWQKLFDFERRNLQDAIEKKYSQLSQNIEIIKTRLDGLAPNKLLKIGYSMVEKDGKRLNSYKNITDGDVLKLHFVDGNITVKIEKIGD